VFQKFSFLRSLFAYEFAFYAAWAEKVSPALNFNDFKLSQLFGIDIDPVFVYCHPVRHRMWSASK
jgi:hypothetical protein